ncbi:AAA domain-containing protein [Helicobacter sp. 11S03491-1]|uniref:AAA domain-containing protein n=1 Tax=Helicobacter sp. 11S03491-1 TaxID=1476196 RepID=UPI000BC5C451|nr:AAA domain-containing protein [Helicobacter sp. 11S03491-1]PAF43914.1 hypothetical protein BKH45_00070 [Helicobacter sp. 11S03491-1]
MIKNKIGCMKDILIKSSQIYYQFLEQNHLGLDEIKIIDYNLQKDEICFMLKSKIFNFESLILRIEQEDFLIGEEGLEQKYFDEKSNILCLNIDKTMYQIITKAQKANIRLFSDLKFLVKNVEDFFRASHFIGLPKKVDMLEPVVMKNATPEQVFAIKSIFSYPITYVWGPPGSGKTQIILFQSLFNLIQAGKKVCVLAPTNNSLEQVLKTLIKKFDELGLNREKILRLGMPTNTFLSAYWEVCDPNILKKSASQNLFSFDVNLKDRLKNSLIIGMTVDGFIRKYRSLEVNFEHIFLDECAFTPLIKSCALCVDNIPLTLLGDHKQLSPICEMPLKDIQTQENFYANLWNLSALNLEEFLSSQDFNKDNSIFTKTQYDQVHFEDIYVARLTKTHRYGDNLAKILDKHIYKNGLRGLHSHTELFYLHSPPDKRDRDYISFSEAKNALELARLFWKDNYGVLTPFVKQRRHMIEIGIPHDKVWTIHGSQGQEFDTVIFSPVVLHYHLTNSSNLKALHALNVAISRIKKRLIIVCDYQFWHLQKGQFLKNILDISKPFDKGSVLPF